MGGPNYPITSQAPQNNLNYQKYHAEELNNVRIQLENTLEQLEWLIGRMQVDLEEYPTPPEKCVCEDGCCK